uniref:Uncharacterized protein n=1 Tax=uncultured Planctomycetota bacterium TaxID=120965 RepID=H5SCB5_9BACT|nr:hypothetical protein HGMM_F08F10C20 [uncultured Planctomycetota bacterium]
MPKIVGAIRNELTAAALGAVRSLEEVGSLWACIWHGWYVLLSVRNRRPLQARAPLVLGFADRTKSNSLQLRSRKHEGLGLLLRHSGRTLVAWYALVWFVLTARRQRDSWEAA